MRRTRRYFEAGSAILMAVGLLVLLAMVGMTFVIIAYLDRREARSLAIAAPMKQLAMGVTSRIQATLVEDLGLYTFPDIEAGGKVSLWPYETAESWRRTVDKGSEHFDKWLASTEPGAGGIYAHATNLYPASADPEPAYELVPAVGLPVGHGDVPVLNGARWLVDTDGDMRTDAVLVDSGVRDRQGSYYFVAVRIVDLSAFVNMNTAHAPSPATPFATKRWGTPVTDVDWGVLNCGTAQVLHQLRAQISGETIPNISEYHDNYVRRPRNIEKDTFVPVFGLDDLMAILWRKDIPEYAAGSRAATHLPNFALGRYYMTTWSSSRDLLLQVPETLTHKPPQDYQTYTYSQMPMNGRRRDLNKAAGETDDAYYGELYKAFYNAIPRDINYTAIPHEVFPDAPKPAVSNEDMDSKRRLLAAQMAVNVMDYTDADDNPTLRQVDAEWVCGVERQVFITELFLKKFKAAGGTIKTYSAMVLYNPYVVAIPLADYRLKVGGARKNFTVASLGPQERMIVRSSPMIPSPLPDARTMTDENLDLSEVCEVVRMTGRKEVYIGAADLGNSVQDPEALDQASFKTYQRDDRPEKARYSVAVYKEIEDGSHDYTSNGEGGTGDRSPDGSDTNLGQPNDALAGFPDVKPAPLYVRNGGFINIGDLLRVYYIGPGKEPLDIQLAVRADQVDNGRWDAGAPVTYAWYNTGNHPTSFPYQVPNIPVACLMSEFFLVNNPAKDLVDNNSDGTPDEENEKAAYGRVNINTAPSQSVMCLPFMNVNIANRIVAYLGTKEEAVGPEFGAYASAGEVLVPIRQANQADNRYEQANGPNYKVADNNSEDGLMPGIADDLAKFQILYSRISNLVSARSDSFAAYITVMRFKSGDAQGGQLGDPTAVKRYLTAFDRSECYKRGAWPEVLMFVEMR